MIRISLLAVALAGCSVDIQDGGGSGRRSEPEWAVHHSSQLKYKAQIKQCYEETKNIFKSGDWRIHNDNRHSDESYWVEAWWGDGRTFAKVNAYRHDHRSYTTVEVWSNSMTPYEARDLARMIHADLGNLLGEEGRD